MEVFHSLSIVCFPYFADFYLIVQRLLSFTLLTSLALVKENETNKWYYFSFQIPFTLLQAAPLNNNGLCTLFYQYEKKERYIIVLQTS